MKIQNVTDASFRKYGKIITEYSFEKILKRDGTHTTSEKTLSMYRLLRNWKYFRKQLKSARKDSADCQSRSDTVMEIITN